MLNKSQVYPFDPAEHGWQSYATPPIIGLIGPFWTKVENGLSLFGFLGQARHGNIKGGVHGGILALLADHATSSVVRAAVANRRTATIQLDVAYISAVNIGEFVQAEAEIIRVTRNLVFGRANLSVNARAVATSSGIWKILEPSGNSQK